MSMGPAIIRMAQPGDEDGLLALARSLDSVNLPAEPDAIAELVARSVATCAGTLGSDEDAAYTLVLVREDGALAGTSTLIARHGTPAMPHVYFEVEHRQVESRAIARRTEQTFVTLRFDEDGRTELAGLVVDPRARGTQAGRQLSLSRLLLMAMRPERFCDRLLAELMPALGPDGRPPLWEHLGARFTSLEYRAADRLSRTTKEFIGALFPREPLYIGWLPDEVRALLGRESADATPARRVLESLGMRYRGAIDPFDAGPHLEADTEDVLARLDARPLRVSGAPRRGSMRDLLVARAREDGTLRVVRTAAVLQGLEVALDDAARRALEVERGELVTAIPFRAATSLATLRGGPAPAPF